MDQCNDSWNQSAQKAASAMKSFAKTILDNADWIATIAAWALITVVLVTIIATIGGVVILSDSPPIPEEGSDMTEDYNEADYVTEPQVNNPIYEVDLGDVKPEDIDDEEGNISTDNLPYLPEYYILEENITPLIPTIPIPNDPILQE